MLPSLEPAFKAILRLAYASQDLLGVHIVSGGKRTFNLPAKVEIICDLFEGKVMGRNIYKFDVHLPPALTALFYTGKRSLITSYKEDLER